MKQSEKEPIKQLLDFKLEDFNKMLAAWEEAEKKVKDLFEEWYSELIKFGGDADIDTAEREQKEAELARKYNSLLDKAMGDARDAFNALEKVLGGEVGQDNHV